MSISFSEVPNNARVPGVYIEIDNSLANNAEDLQKVLIIGALGTGGDTLKDTVALTPTPETAAARFGADSEIVKMVTAFYEQNISMPIYAMSADTITPDLPTTLAAIGDQQFHHIVSAYNDALSITALADFLQTRYEALQQIPGLAYLAKMDTHTNLVTLGNSFNSPFINIFPVNNLVDSAGAALTEAQLAAAWAGQVAPSLAIDPCRPLQTLQLKGVYTNATSEWTWTERNLLLYSGIGTYTTNDAGQVFIERVITTYKENNAGTADDSYLDIMTPATAMYFRQKQRSLILSLYPRHKLGRDGSNFAPGQAVVTPSVIKSSLIKLYGDLEYKAITQDMEGYISSLIIELDPDNPVRVNVLDQPMFVNGLIIYAGKIQFRK